MGFLTHDPVNLRHYCDKPPSRYPAGTRWQCDACKVIYRIEPVTDRGITELEWVEQPLTARDLLDFKPTTGEPNV